MPLKMVDQSRMLLAQERPLERGTHDKRGHGDGRVTGYDLQAERKGGERRRIPGCSTTFCVTTAGAGGGATVKPGDSGGCSLPQSAYPEAFGPKPAHRHACWRAGAAGQTRATCA
jgi:hypothetical protein